VIPAYNAAKTLGPLVKQVKQLKLDPVVVNDGSTDETAKVAMDAGALVISHLHNKGKGSAVRTGFAYALEKGYEAVITMDSDGQHDPAEIPRLLDEAVAKQAAVVVGNRSIDRQQMPLLRRITNTVMSAIVSSISHQRIPDSQCGFRLVRKEVIQAARLSSRRFDIETELLLAAVRGGWTVTSVPVRTIFNGHYSHIRPVRDGLRFFKVILRYLFAPPHIERVHGV
jgi:glycosyltransferase involved in cell wall biosynthesis